MTQELIENEQQQVDAAARARARHSTAPDKETPDWVESDFKAGITFALQHLLPGRMERLVTLLKKINDDAGTDLSMPLWEELERMINNYNKTDK